MQNQLLLIEDVESLGRCGDIVSVKPGYARNFLLPKKKALVATKGALITGMQLSTIVKVDPEGNMYGSVNASDIVALFAQQGITLDKKSVVLAHPIKELGDYTLELRLKEGVGAAYTLSIVADHPVARFVEEKGSEAVEA
jgi:large subunit ribosomal protein L9